MERFIYVRSKDKARLADLHGCRRGTVTKALRFQLNSTLAQRIRCHAVNHMGGRPLEFK